MKKLVIVLVAGLLSIQLMANTNTDINEKVKASFKATFPNAQSVKWHENGNTFTVSFIRNSIDHRVEYDTEGNIIQTTRFYGEQNLPAYLLAQVKKRFEGKKIHFSRRDSGKHRKYTCTSPSSNECVKNNPGYRLIGHQTINAISRVSLRR